VPILGYKLYCFGRAKGFKYIAISAALNKAQAMNYRKIHYFKTVEIRLVSVKHILKMSQLKDFSATPLLPHPTIQISHPDLLIPYPFTSAPF